ncbi:MAG: hypothetical protein AB1758_20900 [Candidatus Eremiobacterota bacterium]
MSKMTGVLKKTDLEGGVWVFTTDDGVRYHLEGLPANLQRDGARLEVDGKLDTGAMGIGMMGDTLVVSSARAL